ncbi:MAG: YceI family protein [Balneolaceae bacterium]
MKRLLFIPLLFSLLFAIPEAKAQVLNLQLQAGHEMKIDGSANVRSWDADVKNINASVRMINFDFESIENLLPEHFQTMRLTIPVRNIESDSGRLTDNLQGYLKGDEYPVIRFTLNEVESIEYEDGQAVITAKGTVNAAGVDHQTTMVVNASLDGDTITFTGAQDLLMTNFNIDPPTAVMGTIRARDEITISYTVTFVKS